jgi:hypothetical protein
MESMTGLNMMADMDMDAMMSKMQECDEMMTMMMKSMREMKQTSM